MKLGCVFVSIDDIKGWFLARVTGTADLYMQNPRKSIRAVALPKIRDDLMKLGFIDIKFRWDRYCGCTCGCSPGYRIEVQSHQDQRIAEMIKSTRRRKDKDDFSIYYWVDVNKQKIHRKVGRCLAEVLNVPREAQI